MSEKKTHEPEAAAVAAAETEVASAQAEAPQEPPEHSEAKAVVEAALPADTAAAQPDPRQAPAPETGAEAEPVPAIVARERRGTPRLKLEQLELGVETQGKVMATAKFGVFVDIGAVTDGLVHISEFPKKKFRRIEDVVEQGDVVDVWIKEVDLKGNRISLSMRKKPTRPMSALETGEVLSGTVTSVTKYGAFVEIGSETEGLVHISEMSSGFVEKPAEVVSVGDAVEVRVKEIDRDRERISLSMVGLANDLGFGAEGESPKADEDAAEQVERMPTVVELALRKALSDMQDSSGSEEDEEGEAPSDTELEEAEPEVTIDRSSLGEVYERMLDEYRESKKGE